MNGQDDSFSIKLEKAGSLKKCIKKKELPNVEKLKITGEINSEDIYFITTLPHIKVLDLSHVTLQSKDEKAKDNKGKFIITRDVLIRDRYKSIENKSCEILTIPSNTTLEELIISQSILIAADGLHLKKLTLTDNGSIDNFCFSSHFETKNFFESLRKNITVDTIQTGRYFYDENDYKVYHETSDIYSPNEYFTLFYPIFPKYKKILLNGSSKTVLACWDDCMELTVLAEVDSISPYAYLGSKMTTLKLPEQMSKIPQNGFNYWKSLESVDLNNVTEIDNSAFLECKNLKIVKAEKVKHIGDNAFFGCEKLETIIADDVNSIGDSAFYQNRCLTSITLKNVEDIASKAFYGTSIEKLVIPATIKRISMEAFEGANIKQIEFLGNTPPEVYKYTYDYNYGKKYVDGVATCSSFNELPDNFWGINYTIPNGAGLNYDKGLWYEFKMIEKDSDKPVEYEIVVEEPGKLKELLTDEMIENAEILKVRGFLYDEEIAILDLCKHLRKLDLKRCYVTETAKSRQAKAADAAYIAGAMAFVHGGMVDIAEDGLLNDNATLFKNFYLTRGEVYDIVMSSSPDCVLPEISGGMCKVYNKILYNNGGPYFKYLEEIEYPVQLNQIEQFGSYVKNVVLPRCATKINSLRTLQDSIELPDSLRKVYSYSISAPNVSELVFPASLTYCSGYAFGDCISLRKIDFSSTQIYEFDCYDSSSPARSLPNIEEIHFPESLIELYAIKYLFGEKPVKVYFKSKASPKGLSEYSFRDIDIVYIPKGCRSGWIEFISKTKATVIEY